MRISRIVTGALLVTLSVTTAFGDEKQYTLQDAYASALGTNENIKIAEEGVVQADSTIDQARSYIYPHLAANAGNTWYNETLPPNGGSFLFQPLEQFQAGLVLTQPLYTGGRTLAAYRTAKTLGEVSRTQLTASQQDMLMNVANAYYEVLRSQKLVDVSKDSLSRMEHYKKVTERVATTRRNKASISDLLRAKTLVSQAGIFVVTAQDRLKIARMKLSLLTRLPENALITEPRPQEKPAEDLDRLRALALEHRDDYAGALLKQKVADENITIVKGGHLPQVYAEGGILYQDSRPAIVTDATVYYGGIRLQIPIFEGGLMKAEVSSARSKLRQTEYATKLLERNIETDVYESYVNLQTLTTVLASTKLQYADAKENFDTVTNLFSEGLASSLAVIDSQQALFLAEREFVGATYDREVAVLQLQKS
ncbi:MAG: TolC family protein, partial [Methanothrix sp.]|nr:TolC family protein [Methanothrix sp.]